MKITTFLIAGFSMFISVANAQVIDQVDWKTFLSRHDMVWNQLPDRFESAAYTGNGKLGTMVFTAEKGKALRWQMGRTDVSFNRYRIPVGDLLLKPRGTIASSEMRLDLWNAEVRGSIVTDKGNISLRIYTHTDQMINICEVVCTGDEQASWSFAPGLATNPRKLYRKEAIGNADQNIPPVASTEGDVSVSFQPLKPAGGHATAWKIVDAGGGRSTVYASVGFSKENADNAKKEAVATVNLAAASVAAELEQTHRAWWHGFWPEGFVSIPDTRLESFYYIQMYKMASATRPGRPAIDLMGPWFRNTPWAMIWWNLNIQLTYWPQLTGNRLELGESLCELIDAGQDALAENAGQFKADSAAIGRTSTYDCRGGVSTELCNLPWAMHNYWLQYRYSMDETKLRKLFPILKRSINYYIHHLEEGKDGKLHLTTGLSPEYPDQPKPNPDCNIDLALLRWGCQTLLDISDKLKLNDPLAAQWKDTLQRLTPYPQDENGLRVSASTPFAQSHRHYSHLLMIYPLYTMTVEQPENKALVEKSLKHWMGMPKLLAGYSYTGAASISAMLGEGNESARYLNKLLDSKIPPNTLYVEAGPCIETPLSAAASLNDMLLSSWGDKIRVFPAVPGAWKDVAFHNLRTQGAFLVSASRKQGQTQWVRIKSLAGEPCRIRPNLQGEIKSTVPQKQVEPGVYELQLTKGQEAILYTTEQPPNLTITPVAADPARCNFYGSPRPK